MSTRRERGFALVAAVAASAAFAWIALEVVEANQGQVAAVRARLERARLIAAADAGIAMAIRGLADPDRGQRWSIDGRRRLAEFEGTDLAITVEDERGKAPISQLNDEQVRALFRGAGASGDRLDALVTEFRQWRTEDDSAPDASGSGAQGPPIRHGPLKTVGELAALRDMTPALFARIAPVTTVFFEESGGFAPQNARPLAIETMGAGLAFTGDEENGEPDIASQRATIDIAEEPDLVGRTLTVRVQATDHAGARAYRMAIVELTGDKDQPYWIRYVE